MERSQASGYLLEDILTKLIEVNGYEVISTSDGVEIRQGKNGLNVLGRGGYHQVDSLGELKYTPPFTYPIRLFVEAKFYKKRVGIDKVRMGIGLLSDINSNYKTMTINNQNLAILPYNYHYVMFSTSGFSKNAYSLALAHKIFLVDLKNPEYKLIIKLINEISIILSIKNGRPKKVIDREVFNEFRINFIEYLKSDFDSTHRDKLISIILKILYNIPNSYEINYKLYEKIKDKSEELEQYFKSKSLYFVNNQQGQNFCMLTKNDREFRKLLTENNHMNLFVKNRKRKKFSKEEKVDDHHDLELYYLNNSLRETLSEVVLFQNNMEQPLNLNNEILFLVVYLDGKFPTLCTLKINEDL